VWRRGSLYRVSTGRDQIGSWRTEASNSLKFFIWWCAKDLKFTGWCSTQVSRVSFSKDQTWNADGCRTSNPRPIIKLIILGTCHCWQHHVFLNEIHERNMKCILCLTQTSHRTIFRPVTSPSLSPYGRHQTPPAWPVFGQPTLWDDLHSESKRCLQYFV